MSSEVQAVIFRKSKFTTSQCREWLRQHNYTPIKRVHTTKNYHRYRLVEPDDEHFHYRNEELGKKTGIYLVLAYPGKKTRK